jgi:hypothetical protein
MNQDPTERPLGFDPDIRPLFRESDRESMDWAFDLWSCDDVRAHGEEIASKLKDGTMPCDEPWPADQVSLFERWLAQGAKE